MHVLYKKLELSLINRATHLYSTDAMAWLTLENTTCHMCHHAKFGCSRSNGVRGAGKGAGWAVAHPTTT